MKKQSASLHDNIKCKDEYHTKHHLLLEQKTKGRNRNAPFVFFNFNSRSAHAFIPSRTLRQFYKFQFIFDYLVSTFLQSSSTCFAFRKLNASHLLTRASTLLLLIWPNHLNLVSLILFSVSATPTFSLITSFLIPSNLIQIRIQRIIFISNTIILISYRVIPIIRMDFIMVNIYWGGCQDVSKEGRLKLSM